MYQSSSQICRGSGLPPRRNNGGAVPESKAEWKLRVGEHLGKDQTYSAVLAAKTPLSIEVERGYLTLVAIDTNRHTHFAARVSPNCRVSAHDLVEKLRRLEGIDLQRARFFIVGRGADGGMELKKTLERIVYALALLDPKCLGATRVIALNPRAKQIVVYDDKLLIDKSGHRAIPSGAAIESGTRDSFQEASFPPRVSRID